MKLKDISHWTITPQNEALLFFAQRIDELLFTYSLDTYKPPCMTPSSLVTEAISTLEDIDDGVLDQQTLTPVIEELEWAIKDDPVSRKLFTLPYKKIFNQITEKPLHEAKNKLEILRNSIKGSNYLRTCFELLNSAIHENRKEDINTISRALVSTLINKGINKNFLSDLINQHFFTPKSTPFADATLSNLIKKIPNKKYEFDVFFSTSKLIKGIYETSEIFRIHEYKKDDYKPNIQDKVESCLALAKPIICIKAVRAFDRYSAYKDAEKKLEKVANLYSIFHHKNSISWDPKAVVYNTQDESIHEVEKPNSATQNGFDLTPQKASKHLNNVIRNFSTSSDSSFFKFDSVVDLHGLASKSDSESSQLLNIWIAIETITPQTKKSQRFKT